MFVVLNNPNKNLVVVEDLELFSTGRFSIIVSNSSLCSFSEGIDDDDGFRFERKMPGMYLFA